MSTVYDWEAKGKIIFSQPRKIDLNKQKKTNLQVRKKKGGKQKNKTNMRDRLNASLLFENFMF